jgi:hypothetical protein
MKSRLARSLVAATLMVAFSASGHAGPVLSFDQALERVVSAPTERTAFFYLESDAATAQLTNLLRQLRPYQRGLNAAMPIRASEDREIVDTIASEIAQIGVDTVVVHAPAARRAEFTEAVRKFSPRAAVIVLATE